MDPADPGMSWANLVAAVAAAIFGLATLVYEVRNRRSDRRAQLELPADPDDIGLPGDGLWIEHVNPPPNRFAQISGAVQNSGSHIARDVRLTVFHGPLALRVMNATLPLLDPDHGAMRFDFTLLLADTPPADPRREPTASFPTGTPIRVQFTYRDGDPSTPPFSRCFKFAWTDPPTESVSVVVPCPLESYAVESAPVSARGPRIQRRIRSG